MTVYSFSAKAINGENISLHTFEGKVLLIVNTASKCGFTPQYQELQRLYEEYQSKGFEILGFPCGQFMNQEYETNQEIAAFCSKNYGVTFPLFEKIKVNGADAHPLYAFLKQQAKGVMGSRQIKWNFTKFLIDRNGNPIARFAPSASPESLRSEVEKLL